MVQQTTAAQVTYTKLRDGGWGLRGKGLTPGAQVLVTKKSGATKRETVVRILWTGEDGTQIATAESTYAKDTRRTRGGRRRSYRAAPVAQAAFENGDLHAAAAAPVQQPSSAETTAVAAELMRRLRAAGIRETVRWEVSVLHDTGAYVRRDAQGEYQGHLGRTAEEAVGFAASMIRQAEAEKANEGNDEGNDTRKKLAALFDAAMASLS